MKSHLKLLAHIGSDWLGFHWPASSMGPQGLDISSSLTGNYELKRQRKDFPLFRATDTNNSQDLQWGKTGTGTGRVKMEAGQEAKHWAVLEECPAPPFTKPDLGYPRRGLSQSCPSPRAKSYSQWEWLRKSNLQRHWSPGLHVDVCFSWYPLWYPLWFLVG